MSVFFSFCTNVMLFSTVLYFLILAHYAMLDVHDMCGTQTLHTPSPCDSPSFWDTKTAKNNNKTHTQKPSQTYTSNVHLWIYLITHNRRWRALRHPPRQKDTYRHIHLFRSHQPKYVSSFILSLCLFDGSEAK